MVIEPLPTAADSIPAHDDSRRQEAEYARMEAETRRTRPATGTAAQAIGVWMRAPSVMAALSCTAVSVVWRAILPGIHVNELGSILAVVLGWPLLEWSAHRWVLHLRPRRIFGVLIDPYFAQRHRTHHKNPSYFPDVFLPVGIVLGAWVVFTGLLLAAGCSAQVTATFMISMSVAACVYEWMHFMAHADFVPPGSWLRRVAERHRQHHYRNEQAWFAFTVPAVDDVFGTGGHVRSVPRSTTTRSIGIP